MMKYATLAAASVAVLLTACAKTEEAPAAEAEAAPVPVEAPAIAASTTAPLPPEAIAFIGTLSPMELGQARLSCVEPLRTAQAWPAIWSPEMAAKLASVENFSRTKLLTQPPLNALSIAEARVIMDAGPQFNANSKPTADEIEGVGQCLMLAQHYAAEQVAG